MNSLKKNFFNHSKNIVDLSYMYLNVLWITKKLNIFLKRILKNLIYKKLHVFLK